MESYSPHRDAESPMHSPHRLRYYDPHRALGEIQRSLSRSPSKNTSRAASPSINAAQYQPSLLSPSRRSTSDFVLQGSFMTSPFANRNTPGNRLSRPIMRRTAQTTGTLRTRTSPKSPSKRILTESNLSGNATPMPLRKRSSTEADREQGLEGGNLEDKENSSSQEEAFGYRAYTRQEKRRSGGNFMNFLSPQSPMKRPDPPTHDDHNEFQNPSAKRRSLHGAGMDFSIFESDALTHTVNENRSQDDNDWLRTGSPAPSSRFSTIPKRSSSLRKSTVQQRQSDRPPNLKFNQLLDVESAWAAATPKQGKGLRMSLDNYIDPLPRESPFSAQGHLLSASIHPATSAQQSQTQDVQSQQSRHPLSRTMTQSSSTSSFLDESPTHEPVHRPTRPRSYDFSKSLPVGASRPSPADDVAEQSSQGSFATPGNYKSARPLPAAFMSTGLISKKNRNVDDPNAGLPKAHMPDTPCKKQTAVLPVAGKFSKSVIGRAQESFGVPPSPLDHPSMFSRSSAFPFAAKTSIFGTRPNRASLMRKASFASIASDDKDSQSPSKAMESQSTDSELPPTPSKHIEALQRKSSISPSPNSRTFTISRFNSSTQGSQFATSKLSPVQASPGSVEGDSDSVMEDSPSASLRPKPIRQVIALQGSSFTQGRTLKNMNSPTPLSRKAIVFPALLSPAMERTKTSALSPVTPQFERGGSPHTPLDAYFPPDPSGLSISGKADRPVTRTGSFTAIPATPTGPREYFPNFSNRPSLNLNAETDTDVSLASRFEKVDLVGTGEFSQVYRASVPPEASPFRKIYSVTDPGMTRSPTGAVEERIFAVKKSRYPYTGPRDRQRKLQEVEILKSLKHGDHVVTFVDSWEHDSHLYIQTEFCEEGTLDVFLAQAGLKARLDDFRIWKILLELSQVSFAHSVQGLQLTLSRVSIISTSRASSTLT